MGEEGRHFKQRVVHQTLTKHAKQSGRRKTLPTLRAGKATAHYNQRHLEMEDYTTVNSEEDES